MSIKLQAHFPNQNLGCCFQTALSSKVFELQSRDCAQKKRNFKETLDINKLIMEVKNVNPVKNHFL